MKVLFDTNIIIDAFLKRNDSFKSSQKTVEICASRKAIGYLSALSLPNIYYILRNSYSTNERRDFVKRLCSIFYVSDLTKEKLLSACERTSFKDFEDCIQEESAFEFDCDYIVTRNPKDFSESRIPILSVEDFLKAVT